MKRKTKNLKKFSILLPFIISLIIGTTINHLPKPKSVGMEISLIASQAIKQNLNLYNEIIDHNDFQNINETLLKHEYKLELFCHLISIKNTKMLDANFENKSIQNVNGNFLNIKYLINLHEFIPEKCISHTLSILDTIFKKVVEEKIIYHTKILTTLQLENIGATAQLIVKKIELNNIVKNNKFFVVKEKKINPKKTANPFVGAFISFLILICFFNFKKIHLFLKKII